LFKSLERLLRPLYHFGEQRLYLDLSANQTQHLEVTFPFRIRS
jgi:hypothetical protein